MFKKATCQSEKSSEVFSRIFKNCVDTDSLINTSPYCLNCIMMSLRIQVMRKRSICPMAENCNKIIILNGLSVIHSVYNFMVTDRNPEFIKGHKRIDTYWYGEWF